MKTSRTDSPKFRRKARLAPSGEKRGVLSLNDFGGAVNCRRSPVCKFTRKMPDCLPAEIESTTARVCPSGENETLVHSELSSQIFLSAPPRAGTKNTSLREGKERTKAICRLSGENVG